jgi:hypothetical protein
VPSVIACASGGFDAVKLPEKSNDGSSRRAGWSSAWLAMGLGSTVHDRRALALQSQVWAIGARFVERCGFAGHAQTGGATAKKCAGFDNFPQVPQIFSRPSGQKMPALPG